MGLVNALQTYLDEGRSERINREHLAQVNEAFYSGEQSFSLWRGSLEHLWGRQRPTVHNHLANVVDAYASRLLRHNPFPTAFPVTASGDDLTAADVANAIIRQRVNAEDYDDKIHRVIQQGTIHGCAGFKVCYDPSRDYVEWLPITLFDFYLDPFCETPSDARWVIFERFIPAREAISIAESAGLKNYSATEESYQKSPTGPERQGVPFRELWLLPGTDADFPEGLYCKYLGDTPLGEGQPHSYFMVNGETGKEEPFLPLALFSPRPSRGTVWGTTPLDEAIEPQKRLNRLESNLAKLEDTIGNVKLMTSPRFAKVWSTTNQVLPMTTSEMQYTRYLQPAQVPSILLQNRVYYIDQIHRLFGLSEVASGQADAKSHVSAKQVAFINELDFQKSAGAHKSLRHMVLRAWRMTLALMQKFYVTERLATFTGASDLQIDSWKGSSLSGADVTLQPTEGLEKYSATAGENQISRMRLGLERPQDVAETSETGLDETQYQAAQERLVEGELDAAMMGALPVANADPQIALRWLDAHLDLSSLSNEQAYAAASLKDQYRSKIRSKEAPQQRSNQ